MGTEDVLKNLNGQNLSEAEKEKMTIIDQFEQIANSDELGQEEKEQLQKALEKAKGLSVNILITGGTGAGKSSTINALFDVHGIHSTNRPKVGIGVDPQTQTIDKYEFPSMTIWDTPGLGDSEEKDRLHAKNMIAKLREKDENGDLLIDLVVVIVDASHRDMRSVFDLTNKIIIPNLGKNPEKRLIVAINQADCVLKNGKAWDEENNKPTQRGQEELEAKVKSVEQRIKDSTGVSVKTIFYKAGSMDDDYKQDIPYNLSRLMLLMTQKLSGKKRVLMANNLASTPDLWLNDEQNSYKMDEALKLQEERLKLEKEKMELEYQKKLQEAENQAQIEKIKAEEEKTRLRLEHQAQLLQAQVYADKSQAASANTYYSDTVESVGDGLFDNIWGVVKKVAPTVLQTAGSLLGGPLGAIASKAGSVLSSVGSGIGKVASSIGSLFKFW